MSSSGRKRPGPTGPLRSIRRSDPRVAYWYAPIGKVLAYDREPTQIGFVWSTALLETVHALSPIYRAIAEGHGP